MKSMLRDPAATLVLAALAFLMGLGVSAAPRFVNEKSDQALSSAVAEAAPAQKNISFQQYRRIAGHRADPFQGVIEARDEIQATLPGILEDLSRPALTVIDSPMFRVRDVPIDPSRRLDRWFTFRALVGADEAITLVEGRLPEPAEPVEVVIGPCDPEEEENQDEEEPGPCDPVMVPLYETAITEETSQFLRLSVGDRVLLRPDPESRNNRNLPRSGLDYQVMLEVAGLVNLTDSDEEIWYGDTRLHRPTRIPVDFSGFDTYGTGLLSPAAYDHLLDDIRSSRFSYTWRFHVDYTRVDSTRVEEIRSGVTQLELAYQGSDSLFQPVMNTGIDQILNSFDEERSLTFTLTSLNLVGLLGLALATGVVLSGLAARRRDDTTILIRGRGGGRAELAFLRLAEGVLILVPAAILGTASTGWLVEGRPAESELVWTVGCGVVLAVVLTLTALPALTGDLGTLLSGAPGRRSARRRAIGEGLIAVVGVVAVVLLRRRGISSGATVDPLLASTPLLVTLVAGMILLRGLPLAFKLAGMLAGRARGVVAMVGFRSLSSRPLPAQLPPVVAMMGMTLAVFGVIFIQTIDANQVRGSWHTVGANYRLEPFDPSGAVSPQLDVSEVDGVEASAAAVLYDAGVTVDGEERSSIQLLAVDIDDYQAVGEGTPVEPNLPESLLMSTLVDAGTESNPLPVLASSRWAGGTVQPGDIINLSIGHRPTVVLVQEVRDLFAGLSSVRPFVVLSRSALGAVSSGIPVRPNRLYVRAPDTSDRALAEAVEDQQPGLRFVSRVDRLQSIQETPAVQAIAVTTSVGLIAAVVLAAVAVISGFALTSRERRRDMGYLRAIGLSGRQMTRATVIEQVPPAIIAAVLGSLAGLLLWSTAGVALDLEPVTGTNLDVESIVSWAAIALMATVVVGTVAAAAAIYSYWSREVDLASVLRRGDRA